MNDRNSNGSNFTHGPGRGNMAPRFEDRHAAAERRRRIAVWIAVVFLAVLLVLIGWDELLRVD